MTLLNAALQFGALAFSIPLVIHLFFRSRFKTLDWGAMYLLESVVRTNRRRMQLTNLLLLLLRCLIPILLAYCLARPVWTGFQALAGDAPRTLIIALDDSRSMAAVPPGEPSRIEVAKGQLRSLLENLTRRDEIILVRSSRLGAVPAKMGVSEALTQLRQVTAEGGMVSSGQLLEAALAASEEASHARRQVVLVSDFQSNALDDASLDWARQLQARWQPGDDSGSADGPARLVIDLLDVGQQWDELSNVSIEAVSVQSPVVVREHAGVYAATIRNTSELPANDLRLIWSIDGQPLEPRVISVDAGATVTNELTHTIDQPGMHEVAAVIRRDDDLLADNRRATAVDVMEEVRVVVVEGAPGKRPLTGQADFLAIALSPFAFGGDDRPDPVRASVVSRRRLVSALDEEPTQVVVLAGVGRLGEAAKRRLAEFVAGGGGLVIFDGPAVRPQLYNQPWESDEGALRFPARLGELVAEDSGAQAESAASRYAFEAPSGLYAPWRILARGESNPLAEIRLDNYRHWELSQPRGGQPEQSSSGGGVVLLRTSGGAPLCVMDSSGAGTVVQFAFSGNDDWTNLPLRPVFLPLIQQLVLDLAGKGEESVIRVGQPIVVERDELETPPLETLRPPRVTYSLRTPDGPAALDPPPQDEPIRITDTYRPGLYWVEKRVTDRDRPERTHVARTLRVAEVPAAESVLVGTTTERLEAFADPVDAQVFDNAADLRSADRLRSFGYELWRILLALLLIALVAELWLQQNLVSRRKSVAGGATP